MRPPDPGKEGLNTASKDSFPTETYLHGNPQYVESSSYTEYGNTFLNSNDEDR